MEVERIELVRQKDAQNSRDVQLTLNEDGSIEFNACDSGKASMEAFGHEDYEFWLKISAENVPRLAFALLREKFNNKFDATDAARGFCKTAGIEYEWSSYP